MDRLKNRHEFLRIAKARKAVRPGLLLQARARQSGGPFRVGFTATKKIGNAVARNFARRRLREAAAKILRDNGLDGFDYVLVARKLTVTRPFRKILIDLASALEDVHRQYANRGLAGKRAAVQSA